MCERAATTGSSSHTGCPLHTSASGDDKTPRGAEASLKASSDCTFRGGAKRCAVAALYQYYKVQSDNAARVQELLNGQTFIYLHKPDSVDPETNTLKPGKPMYTRPFENPAVAHVAGHFYRGQGAIMGRISDLLPRSPAGNPLMLRPLLALACAAIFSALSDLASGSLIPSDFEGKTVQDAYDTYLAILEKIYKKKPLQYEGLMEKLFINAALNTAVNTVGQCSPKGQSPLSSEPFEGSVQRALKIFVEFKALQRALRSRATQIADASPQ
ncbi:hypothetical protein FB45DRAFT_1030807 [Roridomyces roridus]|uniref:DUF6532 domain-containing protein n=1 Tax=Roridomyces roridus TaxID=1738132 RepID=A0AAD7BLU9_9AGAR|nr:hypothetical protein FB45DRAFT_1030807 [Roridomyces roridus]